MFIDRIALADEIHRLRHDAFGERTTILRFGVSSLIAASNCLSIARFGLRPWNYRRKTAFAVSAACISQLAAENDGIGKGGSVLWNASQ